MMGALASAQRANGIWMHPFVGWFGDYFGPRWAVGVGLCFITACWAGFPFVTEYWHLYITFATLLTFGMSMGLMRGPQIAIVRWWIDRRALALGIRSLVEGLSGVVGLPLVAIFIDAYGWQAGAWLFAFMTFVLSMPLVPLYPHHMPQDYGFYPDNLTPEMRRQKAEREAAKRGVEVRVRPELVDITIGEAIRDRSFWMLVLAIGTMMIGAAPLMIFQNARMGALGYSVVEAAAFYSYQQISSYIGRVTVTFFGDSLALKFPVRLVMAVIFYLQAVGLALFGVGTTPIWFFAWALMHGIAAGANPIWNSMLMAAYFGRGAFGTVFGVRIALTSVIGAIAPVLMGWLADVYGWTVPFLWATFAYTLGGTLMLFATPPKKQIRETKRAETTY